MPLYGSIGPSTWLRSVLGDALEPAAGSDGPCPYEVESCVGVENNDLDAPLCPDCMNDLGTP